MDNTSGLCAACGCSVRGDPGAICILGVLGRTKKYHSTCARCSWCDKPVSAEKQDYVPVWGKGQFRQKLMCMECHRADSSSDRNHNRALACATGSNRCVGCGCPTRGDAGAISIQGLWGYQKHYHRECARCQWCDKLVSNRRGDCYVPVWSKLRFLGQNLQCEECSQSDADTIRAGTEQLQEAASDQAYKTLGVSPNSIESLSMSAEARSPSQEDLFSQSVAQQDGFKYIELKDLPPSASVRY